MAIPSPGLKVIRAVNYSVNGNTELHKRMYWPPDGSASANKRNIDCPFSCAACREEDLGEHAIVIIPQLDTCPAPNCLPEIDIGNTCIPASSCVDIPQSLENRIRTYWVTHFPGQHCLQRYTVFDKCTWVKVFPDTDITLDGIIDNVPMLCNTCLIDPDQPVEFFCIHGAIIYTIKCDVYGDTIIEILAVTWITFDRCFVHTPFGPSSCPIPGIPGTGSSGYVLWVSFKNTVLGSIYCPRPRPQLCPFDPNDPPPTEQTPVYLPIEVPPVQPDPNLGPVCLSDFDPQILPGDTTPTCCKIYPRLSLPDPNNPPVAQLVGMCDGTLGCPEIG